MGDDSQPRRAMVRTGLRLLPLLALALNSGCSLGRAEKDREPLEWTGPLADEVDYLVGDKRSAIVRYQFRNGSPDVVRFIEGKADCSCTSVELPEGEFAPGARGEVKFTLDVSDVPGHLLRSRAFIGYEHGSSRRARVLELAVNRRRPLELEPEVVELKPVEGADDGYCQGQVELIRYTKPGRPFDEFDVSPAGIDGDIRITADTGWGEAEKDGGFVRSRRTIRLRTTRELGSGNARIHISGDKPLQGTRSVTVHWTQEGGISLKPETALISNSHPSCEVTVEGRLGQPRKLTWELPEGVVVDGADPPGESGPIVATLKLDGAAKGAVTPRTEPFGVLVDYGDRQIRLQGTLVITARP